VAVTVPERRYDLAGDLLAAAVDETARTGEPVREVLRRLAREAGREIGREIGSGIGAESSAETRAETRADAGVFDRVLEEYGFEPREDIDGSTVLGNCPFHRLAQRHTEIVCGLNLDLLHGVAEATGEPRTVVLDPGPGRCCVRALPPAAP
jgi:predicted ArsR family transcriptional regulator